MHVAVQYMQYMFSMTLDILPGDHQHRRLSMERVVQGEPEPVGRHHHHHHREAWVLVRALNWEIL
jgi:hypothetical protein